MREWRLKCVAGVGALLLGACGPLNGQALRSAAGVQPKSDHAFVAYQDNKGIEIAYARQSLSAPEPNTDKGAKYGEPKIAQVSDALPGPPTSKGAILPTRLKTDVPLVIGGTTVGAGEYCLSIDLTKALEWTFIVSNCGNGTKIEPNQDGASYGRSNEPAAKEVARAPMKVEILPFPVEDLTWQFNDVANGGGRIAFMLDRTMASVPFKVLQ